MRSRRYCKDFTIEIKPLDTFTPIPLEKTERHLCLRHDGILYDGYLYLWEEVKSVKIYREEKL